MSNPNFVSDLVAMAKAFEELPDVKNDLEVERRVNNEQRETIQRLELRLMDLKEELALAHQATRKVEVERDHAERMFLETDDRLNAFRRLVQAFDTDVKSLVQAAEPEAKPEPAVKAIDNPLYGDPQDESGQSAGFTIGDPGPAIGGAFEDVGQGDVGEPVTSTDHTPVSANTASITSEPVHSGSVEPTVDAGVSVQPDPTQATETSSESGLSGSGSQGLREDRPTSSVGASMSMAGSEVNTSSHEEASHPVDPTASSTAGDGHSPENVEAIPSVASTADASGKEQSSTSAESVDDVGYHNEPKIVGTGAEAWAEWDKWCERMNHRYPHSQGGWPPRTQAAQ